jgi:hypothetical protein
MDLENKTPEKRKSVSKSRLLVEKRSRKVTIKAEEALWGSFHVLAERWMSDLIFFNDEIRFLRRLIDRFFIWQVKEENIETTRVLASNLARMEKRKFTIEQKVRVHFFHLRSAFQNPFNHNGQAYMEEHAELEDEMAEFVKEFRTMKQNVFKVTEYVLESEKLQSLFRNSN